MTTVCLAASALDSMDIGGNVWCYLNCALGLRDIGCDLAWLEVRNPEMGSAEVDRATSELRDCLTRWGLGGTSLHVYSSPADDLPDADLLLNLRYSLPAEVVRAFRRSAMVDIDPGMTQLWMAGGHLEVPRHDRYFTLGETVGTPEARFPSAGRAWTYIPPFIHLDSWPVSPAPSVGPFSTITNWGRSKWVEVDGRWIDSGKDHSFWTVAELPSLTDVQLELALPVGPTEYEADQMLRLHKHGWQLRQAQSVCGSPEQYRDYIRSSRGEFSCAKRAYVQLQTGWISHDRTLCYLATGRPAVVEDTGPCRFLQEPLGLIRFTGLEGAVAALTDAEGRYEDHCRAARGLVEEHFDSAKVLVRLLEDVL